MKSLLRNLLLSVVVAGCGLLNHPPACAQGTGDFYTNTFPPGFSLIANQLDRGSNTLDEVLSPVPDGSQLSKWDERAQLFHTDTYDGLLGGWTDENGLPSSTTLAPGEAAFLLNPTTTSHTHVFSGQPHTPVLPLALTREVFHYLSRQTNGIGTFENITGLPPEEGTLLLLWNTASQAYQTNQFTNGLWQPATPLAAVGQGVVIRLP
jgi:hypothetical protein